MSPFNIAWEQSLGNGYRSPTGGERERGGEERVMSEQGDWDGSLWISALLLVGWMTDPL